MIRKQAREEAFILVFEKEFNSNETDEILETAKEVRDLEPDEYINKVFPGVYEHIEEIDGLISENSVGWNIKRISKTALCILRLAIYEMKYFDEIEKSARERNIPVMEKEGLEFLIQTFEEYQCHRCLEIGSAIGYSAMMMVSNINDFVVETIELDENRYQEALKNIHEQQLENQIEIHHEDALTIPLDDLKYQEFDCLFIDAAKAQYQKFFEKYMPLVKEKGICIVDNLDFHGMIFDIDHIKNRNTKQLVKKIKRFKDWIFNHDEYQVTYYGVGDGICVIKRK